MKRPASPSNPRLAISVVIPTYRRPEALRRLLAALSKSTLSTELFEVVVIDDGGDLPADEIQEEFGTALDLTLLRQDNAGPADARNRGVAEARGELVAFIDDDCFPDPAWLEILAAEYRNDPGRIYGGRVVNVLDTNPFAETSQLILDLIYEQMNSTPDEALFFATSNMVVPADRFRSLGGFDADFRAAEDREFCERWRRKGFALSYTPSAVVRHAHDLTLWGFFRQHFGYGRGAHAFHLRFGASTVRDSFAFHRDPRKWLLQPFTRGIRSPVKIAALLVLWQVANAAGFFWGALTAVGGRPKALE